MSDTGTITYVMIYDLTPRISEVPEGNKQTHKQTKPVLTGCLNIAD